MPTYSLFPPWLISLSFKHRLSSLSLSILFLSMGDSSSPVSPYHLLLQALSLIPISHYLLLLAFLLFLFLYNFLELHFLRDLFRGYPVTLTFSHSFSSSDLYQSVVSKCRLLHGRYHPTPWLSSPHLQTGYLSLFGKSPDFKYTRHIFKCTDGGTIALDWLMSSDVKGGASYTNETNQQNAKAPIVVVIPGLTSDSSAAYVKHLAFKMAIHGWNVVVSNHRGLGGMSITSDCFYNAGWTEDTRKVIEHLKLQHPDAPLFAVGTSIGANILVKYLGEDGINSPLVGAAAICSPWDLLVCDRFINRRFAQRLYDKVLAVGLQGYARLHQSVLTRLIDWNGIEKSFSIRDFDNYATRVLGKFETVDAYYRHSSCVNFVGNISLPLLCISALDDPVCTREAIPFDECRANENIILATTEHGGHLAYYEGLTANSMWWVRAVAEFFHVLHSSPLRDRRNNKVNTPSCFSMPSETPINDGPFVNVKEDGMVTAICSTEGAAEKTTSNEKDGNTAPNKEQVDQHTSKQPSDRNLYDLLVPFRRRMDQLARHGRSSFWLLAYIAIVTTWPMVGSALQLLFKKKSKSIKS